MKLLVDVNLSHRWVSYLRDQSIEATHWSSLGANNALDIEIMRYALEHGYVVLTRDLDFGHLLASTRAGKPSVVQIRAGRSGPDAIGIYVVATLKDRSDELSDGALITIDTMRTRLHVLPIGSESDR